MMRPEKMSNEDTWMQLVARARGLPEQMGTSPPPGFVTRVVANRPTLRDTTLVSWFDAIQWLGFRAAVSFGAIAVLAAVVARAVFAAGIPQPLDIVESFLFLEFFDV